MEEVITDMGTVFRVISSINTNFPTIMKKINPYSYHQDPINYYLTGSCTYYAEILHDVFEGYANFCCTETHAFVKIGSHYYDVAGVYNDAQFGRVEFEVFPFEEEEYFYAATLSFGRKSNFDEKIRDELTIIGKETLAKILEEKSYQKENTL